MSGAKHPPDPARFILLRAKNVTTACNKLLQAKIHNYEALSLRRMTLTINGKSNAAHAEHNNINEVNQLLRGHV